MDGLDEVPLVLLHCAPHQVVPGDGHLAQPRPRQAKQIRVTDVEGEPAEVSRNEERELFSI